MMCTRPTNFGLLGLSVLELGPGMRQTDGRTDTGHYFYNAHEPRPTEVWGIT